MRKLIMVALASATFGGAVGALATAAVPSEASPEAIAAAVQRVSDTKLTAAVNALGQKLGNGGINGTLSHIESELVDPNDVGGTTSIGGKLDALLKAIGPSPTGISSLHSLLLTICANTRAATGPFCQP